MRAKNASLVSPEGRRKRPRYSRLSGSRVTVLIRASHDSVTEKPSEAMIYGSPSLTTPNGYANSTGARPRFCPAFSCASRTSALSIAR